MCDSEEKGFIFGSKGNFGIAVGKHKMATRGK